MGAEVKLHSFLTVALDVVANFMSLPFWPHKRTPIYTEEKLSGRFGEQKHFAPILFSNPGPSSP